jgi:hypothetical protein
MEALIYDENGNECNNNLPNNQLIMYSWVNLEQH